MTYTKYTVSAIALFTGVMMFSGSAFAADAKDDFWGSNVTLNPTIKAQINQIPGIVTDVANLGGRVTTLEGWKTTIDTDIAGLKTGKANVGDSYTKGEDDALLAGKADKATTYTKTEVDAKNGEQDGRLDGHDGTLTNHEGRITGNTNAITANNTRLNSFNGTGGTLESWAGNVDATLMNHGDRIATAETRLDGHDQTLALHSQQIARLGSRVDKAFEGVAMAMALQTPHVDVGKRIALTGGYANFEGYNAIATAATIRFDQTWQLGAGVSYGTDSNQVGVKANVTAQW